MSEERGCTTTMTEPALRRASPRHVTPFEQAQRNFSQSFKGASPDQTGSELRPRAAGASSGGEGAAPFAADATVANGSAFRQVSGRPSAGTSGSATASATVSADTAVEGDQQDAASSADTLPYDRITRLRIQSQRSPGSSPPGNRLVNPSAEPAAAAAAASSSNGTIITPFSIAQPAAKPGSTAVRRSSAPVLNRPATRGVSMSSVALRAIAARSAFASEDGPAGSSPPRRRVSIARDRQALSPVASSDDVSLHSDVAAAASEGGASLEVARRVRGSAFSSQSRVRACPAF